MYFREPTEDYAWVSMPVGVLATIILAVLGSLYLGILPNEVMAMAKTAAIF
jgi:NADH-quinone oxidoreductase subunit N